MRAPLGDGNFWLYLYSSGTQYFVYIVINLFLVLFFRERMGVSSGQLVLIAAFVPLGGAVGGLIAGWFVDRYGTRAIRVTLQSLQVMLLLGLLLINASLPGVHVIAADASDLIAEAVVAMEFKAASEDIGRICHPHPSLSEVMREAALAVDKRALNM